MMDPETRLEVQRRTVRASLFRLQNFYIGGYVLSVTLCIEFAEGRFIVYYIVKNSV